MNANAMMSSMVVALSLAGLAVPAGVARAQSFDHVDRLAVQLERQAHDLLEEVHAHFRGNPQYVHLDRDVHEIERLAHHMHDVAHSGNLRHMQDDLRSLDRTVHHVEDLVREMGRFRAIDRRAYVHLRRSLSGLTRTVHHLHDDLDRVSGPHHGPGGFPGNDPHNGHGLPPGYAPTPGITPAPGSPAVPFSPAYRPGMIRRFP